MVDHCWDLAIPSTQQATLSAQQEQELVLEVDCMLVVFENKLHAR